MEEVNYECCFKLCKFGEKEKAPLKDEADLMFSQRNNPYCELLQILYWQSYWPMLSFPNLLSIPSKNNNSHQHFCQCLCHHFGSFLGGVGAVGDVWVVVAEVAVFEAFYCAVEVWVYAAQIVHVEYWK